MVCIDDFAIKKRETYGTVMVDIESRKIIDMIPSREYEDVKVWLETYPNIELVSRDGSATYRKAIKLAIINLPFVKV
jgi:transposase